MKNKRFYFISVVLVSFLFFSSLFSVNLPESFGKTQFIIGVDNNKISDQHKVEPSITQTSCSNDIKDILRPTQLGIRHVLFSPDDRVLEILIDLIKNERKSIRMAAFLLTEYNIVKAILAAQLRGVHVEIIFDPKALQNRFAKNIIALKNKGVDIFVYNNLSSIANTNLSNIMHNKFVVFGNNIFGRSIIWTGSFNFTYSAHKVNQENVVILDDSAIVKKFNDRFDHIKSTLCYRYKSGYKQKGESFISKIGKKNNIEGLR